MERVFEIAPRETKYGRREFVGYETAWLFNGTVPFITFGVAGKTEEETRERLEKSLKKYIDAGVGNIHWRSGPRIEKTDEGFDGFARLVVHPYTPAIGL